MFPNKEVILAIVVGCIALTLLWRAWSRMPRKRRFDEEEPVKIVITGAARGIGRRLAQEFIERN